MVPPDAHRILPALLPGVADIPCWHTVLPAGAPRWLWIPPCTHALSSSCSVISQPNPPGNPCRLSPCLLAPDPSSCLRGSPEQIGSCHKHSPWVIKRYLQGSSCPLTHGLPLGQIRGKMGWAEQGTKRYTEYSKVQRLSFSSPEPALATEDPSGEGENSPIPTASPEAFALER